MKKDRRKPTVTFPEKNPNPVLSAGLDGALNYINPAALCLCENLNLKSIEMILPEVHRELVKDCLKSNKTVDIDHRIDGHIFSWSYLPKKSEHLVFIYGSDITRFSLETMLESLHNTLHDLYKLTPAEVKLTLHLVNGFTLKEAAKQSGITEATARYQLREVFCKTGTDRQSELIRRLLIGPID